ncbi:hypothetical protein Bca101_081957 [Brassica carinata]
MDSLSSTQKAKPRKTKAVVKKSRVQILLDLFYRVIQITVVMVTVAKLCYQLVIMFEDSGITRFLINRHLAFILGNAIVITIVAKCGLFSTEDKGEKQRKIDNSAKQSSDEERSKKDVTVKRHRQIITQKQESPTKSYERSRSESSKKSSCGRLTRSETERPADDSDDELRYKIESFIARQRRNQKDEEFSIV